MGVRRVYFRLRFSQLLQLFTVYAPNNNNYVSLALSTCAGSVPVRASKLSIGPLSRTVTELS